MSYRRRIIWMSTLAGGALALLTGVSPQGILIASRPPGADSPSARIPPPPPPTSSSQAGAANGQNTNIKLQTTDAHALWLLHQIDQTEISAAQLAESRSQNDQVKSLAKDLRDDHQKLDDKVVSMANDKGVDVNAVPKLSTGTFGSPNDQTGTGGSGLAPQGTQSSGTESTGGGSSTVQEIPNTGTGGAGSAGSATTGSNTSSTNQNANAINQGSTGLNPAAPAQTTEPLPASDTAMMQHSQRQLQHLSTLQGTQFDRAFLIAQMTNHEAALSKLQGITAQDDDLKDLLNDAIPMLQKHENQARQALQSLQGVGGSGNTDTNPGSTGSGNNPY